MHACLIFSLSRFICDSHNVLMLFAFGYFLFYQFLHQCGCCSRCSKFIYNSVSLLNFLSLITLFYFFQCVLPCYCLDINVLIWFMHLWISQLVDKLLRFMSSDHLPGVNLCLPMAHLLLVLHKSAHSNLIINVKAILFFIHLKIYFFINTDQNILKQ